MTEGFVIRSATSPDDLATLVRLTAAVTPEDTTSLEELAWADVTYPGGTRYLAWDGDRAVGAATGGRIYVYPPEHPDHWMSLVVDPGARRRGIGRELLAMVSADAAAARRTGLQTRAFTDRPEGIAFLEAHGFTEFERARMVRLDLTGLERLETTAPEGAVLTTLAARPDLVSGVHAVAIEAFDDIPGGDEAMAAGDLAEFRARDVDRPGIPADGFQVALDATTGEVVGYASLMFVPGSTTRAWHDMTAVRRSWRGRGVATALKQATIAWAIDHGLTALETGNDVDNAGMRAVNRRLGYTPMPDELVMRGPLFRPADGTSPDDAAS
jgi:GNAT superfamily N-acetyltransferase